MKRESLPAPAVALSAIDIEVAGERLTCFADRALYWPRERMLLVADAHIGKAASFRKAGVPLPPGSTSKTLARLTAAIVATGAEQIVFLGDFLHSKEGRAPQTLQRVAEWRERHQQLTLTLIRGNHDDRAGDPPESLGIDCVDEPYTHGPFALCHHPDPQDCGYVLGGHIHPAVHMSGGLDHARLACFWFGERVGVLPAFGEFTGTYPVRPASRDQVIVVADGAVVKVR